MNHATELIRAIDSLRPVATLGVVVRGTVVASTTDAITAWATLALAFFTAFLALTTRRLAREAGNETRANWRPVLVVGSYRGDRGFVRAATYQDERRTLAVNVLNVGRGPTIKLEATLLDDDDPDRYMRPSSTTAVIPPDGCGRITWEEFIVPDTSDLVGPNIFRPVRGTLTYWDVSYAGYRSDFTLLFSAEEEIEVETYGHRQWSPDPGNLRSRVGFRWRMTKFRIRFAVRGWWRRRRRRGRP